MADESVALRERLARATPDRPAALAGYDVTGVLGRGGMGAVYRALDRARGVPVALKTVLAADATAGVQLKREFRVVAGLSHPNLAQVYELAWADGIWFFVMELVDGIDLTTWARGPRRKRDAPELPLLSAAITVRDGPSDGSPRRAPQGRFDILNAPTRSPETADTVVDGSATSPSARTLLGRSGQTVAPPLRSPAELRSALLQLVAGVRALHDVGLRHGDLKPANVLVRPDGRVVVVDFGLTQPVGESGIHGGTPLYMAPELLTNKGAEGGPSSDWYALGIMLYELLTGVVPTRDSGSIFELLCIRSSGPPTSVQELVAEAPDDLSAACAVLLSPVPVERPDADALAKLFSGGFPAPNRDARRTFRTPFIGRRVELDQLEQALARARAGCSTLAHASGPSGIGKSALVRQFLRATEDLDLALVLRGCCYERENVPYKAFDGIVDSLAGWLDGLDEDSVSPLLPTWAGELTDAFPVLASVPPFAAAHAALGPRPEAQEHRRRTWSALAELIDNVSRRRPLVLFIDDLQWTDADSTAVLQTLARGSSERSLLLLASFREQEASSCPDLAGYFSDCRGLREAGALVEVPIGALPLDDAEVLARETLRGLGASDGEKLAERIARESGQMPFFIEFLARYLTEASTGGSASSITLDDVSLADALLTRLDALPTTQRALVELVAVSDRPVPQAIVFEAARLDAGALPELLAVCSASLLQWAGAGPEDLVSSYHDRIREAVLAAIDPASVQRRHLELGRSFATRCADVGTDAQDGSDSPWLFDAARHLDAAEGLIDEPGERQRASRILLAAGQRAQRAAAFPLALRCFEAVRRFLPTNAWNSAYEIALTTAVASAECAWLSGDFERARARLDEVYVSARSTLDRVRAWHVDIAARIAQQDLLGAIAVGRGGLAELGVTLPVAPSDDDVGAAVQRAMGALGDEGAGRLESLPAVEDPLVQAAMMLLVDLSSSAYYALPALLPILACELIVSSVQKGPSAATPFGLAVFGIVQNAIGMQAQAHETGRLAHRMIERWPDRRLEVRTRLVVHNNVCSWTVPLESTLDDLLATYQLGRATGDFEFAAIAAQCWATNAFVAGRPLDEVERTAGELATFMRAHQQNNALLLHRPLERLVGCMRGTTATPDSLSGDGFDEEQTLAAAEAAGSASVAFVTLSDMLVARYHFGSPEAAWVVATRALPFMGGAASTHHLSTYHLYAPLAASRCLSRADAELEARLWARIDASISQLEAWNAAGAANFAHRLLLVRAERAQARHEAAAARSFYDQALEAVRRTAYVNDEGLVAELAGRFHLATDVDHGRQLLAQAKDGYARWGAHAKVAALQSLLA